MKKTSRPHWYKLYISECPVCGRGYTERERVYGQKPNDISKRYIYNVTWDYCNAF